MKTKVNKTLLDKMRRNHWSNIAEVMGSKPVQALIFSGLISTTSSVVFIAARIAYISFLHRSAHIWFSYISSNYSPLGRFIWIQNCVQFPVGLLAQLVERCTGFSEVLGSKPVQALIFSGLISTTSSVVFIAARIAYISFLHRSAHIWFSYISSNYLLE